MDIQYSRYKILYSMTRGNYNFAENIIIYNVSVGIQYYTYNHDNVLLSPAVLLKFQCFFFNILLFVRVETIETYIFS